MKLWEKAIRGSYIAQLTVEVGYDKAAEILKISREELLFQISRIRWLNDYEEFAAEKLWIINKAGQLVKFKYNNAQRKLNDAIERMKLQKKAVRICLLKARQWGGTTSIEGMIFNDTMLRESRSSMIIAHSLESAEHIRSMSERYYDRYDLMKPPLKKQTEKWWKVRHTQNRKSVESSIRIDTAENLAAGHSFTLHNLHCCLAPDTPVLVEHGRQKRIADVVVGDRVITHNGNLSTVILNTRKTIEELPDGREAIEIHPWLGHPIKMTKQHKVFTRRGWVEAGDLNNDDWLAMPVRRITDNIKSLPVDVGPVLRKQGGGTQRIGNDTFPINEETGFFVGYYLAEGCNSRDSQDKPSTLTFAFCQGEKSYADRAVQAVTPWVKKVEYKTRDYTKTETVRFTNVALAGMVDSCFGSIDEKHIPDWVFDCGQEFCLGLVKGYLSGDGSKTIGKNGINIVSASSIRESLTYQIRDLVASLGIGWGSVTEAEAGYRYGRNCKKQWTVRFSGESAKRLRKLLDLEVITDTGLGIRSQKYAISGDHVWLKIKEICYEYLDEAYDLAVDHEDHSFRTPYFSVSNSEIQKWPHAEEIVKGLFPAVPNSSDTMIFFEGTGAGVGSYWYEFCQRAQHPESEWEFVFVPWFEIEDYRIPVTEKEAEKIAGSLDDEEKALVNLGIGFDYLRWRRREVQDTYKGDLDSFHQQYPSTPEEAFLTSGRPVFPAGLVKKRYSESREGTKGRLYWKVVGNERTAVWADDAYGEWEKWEEPQRGENLFVCGADVAEGIAVEPEFGNRGGDFSAARIFRRDNRTMVATYHDRVDPDIFADELAKAAFYWGASIFPEQNAGGGGNVVILRLKEVRGVRILKTPVFGKKRDEEKSDEVGWETMKNTKRIMIDEMTEAIREGSYKDFDKVVWSECSTYVRDEKGRTNAQVRKYDDLVVATAITLQGDKIMPAVFRYQAEARRIITSDMDVPENWKRREKTTQERVMADNLVEF